MDISHIDFYKIYQSSIKIKIIYIREQYDFNKYHIIGSVNVPYSLLINKPSLFLNKNNHYYIICNDGAFSKDIVEKLKLLGFHLTYVVGGIRIWRGRFISNSYY